MVSFGQLVTPACDPYEDGLKDVFGIVPRAERCHQIRKQAICVPLPYQLDGGRVVPTQRLSYCVIDRTLVQIVVPGSDANSEGKTH
jgi:hypothetical protein